MNSAAADHFFRHEAARIVSLLTQIFGLRNLQLAEDMVQETLLAALNQWSFGEIPENPSAWVLTVARRKVLNFLKRERLNEIHAYDIEFSLFDESRLDSDFDESKIEDAMLRMFFVCCHPDLPIESRIAVTLKILCGFSAREIAQALFTQEGTIQKRLFRAKQEFKNKSLPLEIPEGELLGHRLNSVYLCIYLLFNEGYNSSHPDFLIRKELCLEAMRLCRLMMDHYPDETPAKALMALMCFHVARFESRIDDHGALVIFSRQKRENWNQELIRAGMAFLSQAAQGELLTEYHLEASIAAEHCCAVDFASTHWEEIEALYALLATLKDNPIIELNRAIILAQRGYPKEAILKLEGLKKNPRLQNYYLLHATLGELYSQSDRGDEAQVAFLKAIELTDSKTEKQFLSEKMSLSRAQSIENKIDSGSE